ncbi:hypothetical protein Gpo141_00014575, partial [Globisporangium polare]
MDGLRDAPMRPSMDENKLLAETEALLDTLDAAAFASSRGSTSADGFALNALLEDSPSTHSSATISRPVRPRAPSRDKVREELMELRHVKAKLDVQLQLLQQKHQSAVTLSNTRVQTWRALAERQLHMRQLAEADNAQLKAMVIACLESGDAQKFARAYGLAEPAMVTMMNLPDYARGPLKRPLRLVQNTDHAHVFESLIRRLDTAYTEMDALFREHGMDQSPLQPRSEWYLKDNPFEHPCPVDSNSAYDTFAVNYRMTSKVFEEGESVDYFLVMRRYREATDGRSVMLFATQCDGEMELAGASSHETGWLVVSDAKMLSDVDPGSVVHASSTAVVQSCLRITLTGAEQVGEAKVNRLRSRLTSAFEEDVVFIRQRVASLLLQESRARTAEMLAASGDTLQCVRTESARNAFRDP